MSTEIMDEQCEIERLREDNAKLREELSMATTCLHCDCNNDDATCTCAPQTIDRVRGLKDKNAKLREQLTGAQTTIALAEAVALRHEQTELADLRRVLLVPLDYISVQREEHDNLRLVAEAARRWAHDQQTMNRVALQQAVAALEAKP